MSNKKSIIILSALLVLLLGMLALDARGMMQLRKEREKEVAQEQKQEAIPPEEVARIFAKNFFTFNYKLAEEYYPSLELYMTQDLYNKAGHLSPAAKIADKMVSTAGVLESTLLSEDASRASAELIVERQRSSSSKGEEGDKIRALVEMINTDEGWKVSLLEIVEEKIE